MDVHTDFPFKSTSFTVSQSINSSDPWHESLNPEILTTSACRHIAPRECHRVLVSQQTVYNVCFHLVRAGLTQ